MSVLLPKIEQVRQNGQLGRVAPPEDGTSLLIATVTGGAGVKGVYLSRRQAEEDGIDSTFDINNNCLVYEHIKDFYASAPDGTELHVILLDEALTLTNIFTDTNAAYTLIRNYLREKEGKIKQIGVALNPATEPDAGTGANADLLTAIPLAEAFRLAETTAKRPVFVTLEARRFTGSYASATDLRALNASGVAVMAARDKNRWADLATAGITVASNAAQLGRALGKIASVPVQRSIARVEDGALIGINSAELSGGQNLDDLEEADLEALNKRAYLCYRKHQGKTGYFFIDNPTCALITDDYAYINLARVMDKVDRITDRVLLDELNDEVDVDASTGNISAIEIKALQTSIESALNTEMASNITLAECFIDHTQNVLSTDTIEVVTDITPRGIKRKLRSIKRFKNPVNQA